MCFNVIKEDASVKKMPTALISFNVPADSSNDSRPTPPFSKKIAHLSGRFIENTEDPRLFPLIMSGFDRLQPQPRLPAAPFSKPENYVQSQFSPANRSHLAPDCTRQLY